MKPRAKLWLGALAVAGALVGVGVSQRHELGRWFGKHGAETRSPPRAPRPRSAGGAESDPATLDAAWEQPLAVVKARVPVDIRWEAEHPTRTDYPSRNPFAPTDDQQKRVLSAGNWIGAQAPGAKYFLEYDVRVNEGATYSFYVRRFWRHGPFRWRFDQGEWQTVRFGASFVDDVPLRPSVSVSWTLAGEVLLEPGNHSLRIELLGEGEDGASAWDAFLLTTGAEAPRGLLPPGTRRNHAPPGWFPFEPEADPFAPSELDLRPLNEPRAGSSGYVSARGSDFVVEHSEAPLRFWGVNAAGGVLGLRDEPMRRLARELAKRGVNLVRIHSPFWKPDDIGRVDERLLERLHRLVAILADNGIYTALSVYFPAWLKPRPSDGFPGYDGKTQAMSLLFFSSRLEEIYRGWWRQLLTPKNPYTDRPLAEDPALALVELVNEDSTLFWTFKPYVGLSEPATIEAERAFGSWLAARYGSAARALSTWGGKEVRGDDAAAGRVGFIDLKEIAHSTTPNARARDTAEFLALSMRRFYERTREHLHELGFRSPIVCSNWVTADARRLGPLDKWANLACDVMDQHGYYEGPHVGEAATYSIRVGQRYDDASALLFETTGDQGGDVPQLPVMAPQYEGKPTLVSELNWPAPNRFRAELPVLALAYGSLQGTSGYAFFATDTPGYADKLSKFSIRDPAVMGQFPAAALAFRRGYLRRSEDVASVRIPREKLFALSGDFGAPSSLDAFRAKDVPRSNQPAQGSLDPLLYLAGRVRVELESKAAASSFRDLSPFLRPSTRTATSTTGELSWNWQQGIQTVKAARIEGATGFLFQARPLVLGVLSLETRLEYGAILLVSLDGQPLATSRKMLLQIVSEVENDGWSAPGEGMRTIENVGGPPLVVKKMGGTVRLNRADAAALRVVALDPNGYPWRASRGNGTNIVLLPDALYYLITD